MRKRPSEPLPDKPIWERAEFPVKDVNLLGTFWPGHNRNLTNPFCWTPVKAFTFGGRRFIPLYPCIAFDTKNAGFVVQKTWEGVTIARE